MHESQWVPFEDRADAGRRLAAELVAYRNQAPIVLGLPRGGVPVAYEVAIALGAPLDVWVVRKIGAPFQRELGIGAVAEGGEIVWNDQLLALIAHSRNELSEIAADEEKEVQRRVRLFRGDRPPPEVRGRTLLLVDDGVATGATMLAAIRSLRKQEPTRIVLAVPVASSDTLEKLRPEVDEVVCLEPVPYLAAIGLWYRDFSQTSDDEVIRLLEHAHQHAAIFRGHDPSTLAK